MNLFLKEQPTCMLGEISINFRTKDSTRKWGAKKLGYIMFCISALSDRPNIITALFILIKNPLAIVPPCCAQHHSGSTCCTDFVARPSRLSEPLFLSQKSLILKAYWNASGQKWKTNCFHLLCQVTWVVLETCPSFSLNFFNMSKLFHYRFYAFPNW